MRHTILAATALLAASALPAMAQGPNTTCQGRVVIELVRTVQGTGGQPFGYTFLLQNRTANPFTVDVQIGNFNALNQQGQPPIAVFSPNLPGIAVPGGVGSRSQEIRFAAGPRNGVQSPSPVALVYDGNSAAGPFVRLHNCRQTG